MYTKCHIHSPTTPGMEDLHYLPPVAHKPDIAVHTMPPLGKSGRRIAELFFTQQEGTNNYVCRCGVKRKKPGTSYENLLSHVRSQHPDYDGLLSADKKTTQAQVDRFFNSTKAGNYYGWFDLIINALLPFSFVQSKVAREHVKHDEMSLSTFMRYLPKLTEHVEKKIGSLLPKKISLVFDGWTTGSTHYLAVFASYPAKTTNGYDVRLLTFSPMGDECHLDAQEHVKFITYVLELYGKSWDNVICLIGDNCNTNKAVANNASVPLVGCASHRFNLAVQDILREEETCIAKIHSIMVKLRTLLLSAKLLKLTPLRPKTRNATRWSSAFDMLVRYDRLREFLSELDSAEIDNLSLTTAENRRVDSLLLKLKDLESVTKALQYENTSIGDVRGLFDAVIEQFPQTATRLSSSSNIIHTPLFESGIIKVQLGNSGALCRDEREILSSLACDQGEECSARDTGLSFAERALKRQKLNCSGQENKYMDTRFVLPTSNICERLFSKAGHVLNDRRKALSPANLESQVFLHLNSDLWSSKDVNKLTQE